MDYCSQSYVSIGFLLGVYSRHQYSLPSQFVKIRPNISAALIVALRRHG